MLRSRARVHGPIPEPSSEASSSGTAAPTGTGQEGNKGLVAAGATPTAPEAEAATARRSLRVSKGHSGIIYIYTSINISLKAIIRTSRPYMRPLNVGLILGH